MSDETDANETTNTDDPSVIADAQVEATQVEGTQVLESPEFTVMLMGTVLFELPSASPVVTLLEESVPYRSLSFPVGLPEAQALASAIARIDGARPSTHELFMDLLRQTKTDIVAVRLVRQDRGVYFAELDMVSPTGRVVLDCRPTDALILAMRQGVMAPILCDVTLL